MNRPRKKKPAKSAQGTAGPGICHLTGFGPIVPDGVWFITSTVRKDPPHVPYPTVTLTLLKAAIGKPIISEKA